MSWLNPAIASRLKALKPTSQASGLHQARKLITQERLGENMKNCSNKKSNL
jgi:hypothetical protein